MASVASGSEGDGPVNQAPADGAHCPPPSKGPAGSVVPAPGPPPSVGAGPAPAAPAPPPAPPGGAADAPPLLTTAPWPAQGAPATSRDATTWLAYAAAGFLVGQVAAAVLLAVVAAVNGHESDVSRLADSAVPPAWVVIPGLVGLWFGFVGSALAASRRKGTGSLRRDMGLEVRGRDVVIGAGIGVAGQLALLPLLYLPLEHVIPNLNTRLSQPAKHLTGGFPGADLVVIGILTVAVVPVVEELFFRGLVLRALVRVCKPLGPALGPTLACLSTGIIFGLAHFEALQLLGLAAFGVVLSIMAYRFRRLGPSIFAHATFNLLAVVAVASSTPGTVH